MTVYEAIVAFIEECPDLSEENIRIFVDEQLEKAVISHHKEPVV